MKVTLIRVGFLPEETFLPGQWKEHGFFRIFPLSSGRNGRMGSMITLYIKNTFSGEVTGSC